MAEMTPLYYSPLGVIQIHNPMGNVLPQNSCCQQWLPDLNVIVILIDHNNWYHFAFRVYKAAVNRNSLLQIMYSRCIYQARSASRYFSVLAQSAWDG